MIRLDNAFKEHEKFFFILQQFEDVLPDLWEYNTIDIKIKSQLTDPYIDNSVEMHKIKISNFILEGIEEILHRIKSDTRITIHPNFLKEITIIRTCFKYSLPDNIGNILLYLPQTNQIFFLHDEDFLPHILLSHGYAAIIKVPLAGIEPATHGLEVHRSVH